ncbi:glycosyltransferase family 2 protein [Patescibacteria group bacterium]|nr:glycosyltransferase family 2 protein [Patescibacteria group bacterium]MBU1256643.1 glycosyltransferase family 2 protein [Patescibacteria group bacterium]MBU1457769.1 glycosyltransferase family 2 protein [Patescibacteria group bacterium]
MKKIKNSPHTQRGAGQPLISIAIPVYNAGEFLHQAINSILNQTYKNLEIIAVDDGSTDNSWGVLKQLQRQDKRLKIFKNNKNQGIGFTSNKAIKHAKSNWIARMDADDISLPTRLQKQIEFLLKHPKVVAVGGQCKIINTKGERVGKKIFPTKHKDIKSMMFNAMSIQQPTVMFNTNLLPKNFSWYNNSLSPVDDLDLFFRLFKYGQLANLGNFILKYRQYHQSSSLKNPKKTFALTKKVRNLAIKNYEYKPSVKSKLIAFFQELIIKTLPSPFIYPAYSALRGITPLKANFRSDSFNIFKYFPNLTTP